MKSTIQIITLLLTAVAMLTGCRTPLPCPDCDDHAYAVDLPHEDDDPLPDLPCGGADFMTDSYNCGSCGNKCPLWLEGTDWEAGTCSQGECGPGWTSCVADVGTFNTCEELCSRGGRNCFARGCSGLTALLQRVGFDETWHRSNDRWGSRASNEQSPIGRLANTPASRSTATHDYHESPPHQNRSSASLPLDRAGRLRVTIGAGSSRAARQHTSTADRLHGLGYAGPAMPRALPLLAVLGLLAPAACERARVTTPADAEPVLASEPTSVETEPAATPVDETPATDVEPEPPESEPDRHALATTIREQLPTLTSCYENQLQHDRSLRGKLRVTITIEAGGWVSDALIDEDGVGSEAVRACVVERLRTWSFVEVELAEATELGFAVDFQPDAR